MRQLLEILPYPSIVITRSFQIEAANEFSLRLLEVLSLIRCCRISVIWSISSFAPYSHASSIMQSTRRVAETVLYGIQLFKQNKCSIIRAVVSGTGAAMVCDRGFGILEMAREATTRRMRRRRSCSLRACQRPTNCSHTHTEYADLSEQ